MDRESDMKISAAISPCPNDVFIFSGILSGAVAGSGGLDFAFAYHDVETLNRGAQEGLWDLAKISYANYARVESRYRLLGCGGALGRGCGPLLLSNTGRWDPGGEVLVPGRNTTANFLLDFFGEGRPFQKTFLPFDELYRRLLRPEPCQGVVIHEMRFTFAGDGLHLVRDLGENWEKQTGHPIPLGACALRRDCAVPAAEIETLIRASLDWAYAHEDEALELCRRHSQSMSDAVLKSHIDLYVNEFSRDLGKEGREAVEFFLARSKGMV
jgi:1,4-dihydroxy-6-naphthoate synthase